MASIRPASRRWRISGLILLILAVLVVVSFAFPWNLNRWRGWVGQKVQDSTGRRLSVDGNLTLYWGLFRRGGTHITAERLRFANPEWAKRPEMLTADKVDADIALWPLLSRRVVLPTVVIDRPDAEFQELADGRRNWYLDRKQSDSGTPAQIGALTLNTGHVSYLAEHRQTNVQADVATEKEREGSAESNRIVAHATGKYNGLSLDAKLRGDDVLRLRDTSANYGFELHAIIGRTRVDTQGSLAGLTAPVAADLRLVISGSDMGEWYRIAHVGLPETPPYRTDGHVTLKDGVWHYDQFTGHMGNSDLGGSVAFEPVNPRHPKRPFLSGKLTSKELDLNDLAPVIGKTPAAKGEASSGAHAQKTARAGREKANPASSRIPTTEAVAAAPDAQAASPEGASGGRRVLPQKEFNTNKWDTLDADLELEASEIRNLASMPFDNLRGRLKLEDKLLLLTPLNFGFGNGELRNEVRLDGRSNPIHARLDGQFRNVQLDKVMPGVKVSKSAFGNLNGKVNLEARGNSVAQWLGTANGNIQLAMGRGVMSNLMLELLDLDAAEALGFLIAGDKTVPIRCAIADLDMKNGLMTPKVFVFDTTDTIVRAEGHANFADETLDLRITPVPKDKSFLTLRVPFNLRGNFGKPSVSPDKRLLAARLGGSVLLGLLNPFAALLPLIETGPGKDSPCSELLGHVKNVPVKNVAVEKADARQDKPSAVRVTPVPAKK